MSTRLLASALFLALSGALLMRTADAGDLGLGAHVSKAGIRALQKATPAEDPGSWPTSWIKATDRDSEPPMQVHAYNEDTGAFGQIPVRDLVEEIIANWLAMKAQASIELIAAHTHGHFDHVQSDGQFDGHHPVSDSLYDRDSQILWSGSTCKRMVSFADEHPLQFEPGILADVLDAALDMGNDPSCTIFDRFVIHPVYLCGITWNG